MPLLFGRYCYTRRDGPVSSGQWTVDSGQFFQQLRLKFPEEAFIEPKFLLPATSYQLPAKSVNIQPGKTLIINLTKSEEQLLSEMHPKTRYNIKLAQKHGVEIKDEFEISIGNGLFTKKQWN